MRKEIAWNLAGAALFATSAILRPAAVSAQDINPQFPVVPGEPGRAPTTELLDANTVTFTTYDGQQMREETIEVAPINDFEVEQVTLPEKTSESVPDFKSIKEAVDRNELEKAQQYDAIQGKLPEGQSLLYLPTIENITPEQAEFQERYDRITSIYKKWQPNAIFFLMYEDGGGVVSVMDPQKPEYFENKEIRDYLKVVEKDLEYVDSLRDELKQISEETGINKSHFNIRDNLDYATLLLSNFTGHQGNVGLEIDKDGKEWLTTTVSLRNRRYMDAEAVTTALPPQIENTQNNNPWYSDTVNNRVSVEAQSNTTDRAGVLLGPSYSRTTNTPGGLPLAAIAMEKLARKGLVDGSMYEYSVEEQAMRDACAILNKLGLTDEITKAIAEKNPDPRIQKIHAHVLAFLSTFSQLESQEVQSPVQTDEFRRLFDYIKSHTPEGVIPQGYGWEGMDVVMPRPLSKDDVQLLKQPLITAVTQNGSLESPNRDFSIYNLGVTLAGTPGNHSIDSRPVHIMKDTVKVYGQITLNGARKYLPITDYCLLDLTPNGTQTFTCPTGVQDVESGKNTSFGEFIAVFEAVNPFSGEVMNIGVHVDPPVDLNAAQVDISEMKSIQYVDQYLFPEGTTWAEVEDHLKKDYAGNVPEDVRSNYKTAFDQWEKRNGN
jgi:hypothetical protein